MAKVTTQSIPAEDRINYKRACQIATTRYGKDYVRKRFPWRLPLHQDRHPGGASAKQRIQRDRFKYGLAKYDTLDATAKARWAAANPEWHSYLFGYNFFMLEAISGGGVLPANAVIKSIQHLATAMASVGTATYTLATTVDPAKTVIFINGASYVEISETLSAVVHPYLVAVAAATVKMAWAVAPSIGANVSIDAVEYI